MFLIAIFLFAEPSQHGRATKVARPRHYFPATRTFLVRRDIVEESVRRRLLLPYSIRASGLLNRRATSLSSQFGAWAAPNLSPTQNPQPPATSSYKACN